MNLGPIVFYVQLLILLYTYNYYRDSGGNESGTNSVLRTIINIIIYEQIIIVIMVRMNLGPVVFYVQLLILLYTYNYYRDNGENESGTNSVLRTIINIIIYVQLLS
jgi:hypothetical protein